MAEVYLEEYHRLKYIESKTSVMLSSVASNGEQKTLVLFNQEENILAVRDLLEGNPHITTRQILCLLDISSGSLQTILHEHLKVRKLCARWVPHRLSPEQKTRRVDFCQSKIGAKQNCDWQVVH